MTNNLRLDSHKLIYHPEVVARWLKGEEIYPIEVEISPSGACNHRCVFCAVDYLGYQPAFLKKDVLLRDIQQMYEKGLKSVICSGEGEPLLNRDFPEIANKIKRLGVDVAVSSNGALFDRDFSKECLHSFTWVRFSIASLHGESYYTIQRAPKGDLDRVKRNLQDAVNIKRKNKLSTTLGVQCLLMQENASDLLNMAKELKEIGVDYFTIKPFSQHLHSGNKMEIDYNDWKALAEDLEKLETDDFAVYFRLNAMERVHHKKIYEKCLGLPFMTHIDAKGNVWPCIAHIGVDDLCYGNIYEQTFADIWEGKRRRAINEKLWSMDINKVCREACRLDVMNQYLDELKHPGDHVNFI